MLQHLNKLIPKSTPMMICKQLESNNHLTYRFNTLPMLLQGLDNINLENKSHIKNQEYKCLASHKKDSNNFILTKNS